MKRELMVNPVSQHSTRAIPIVALPDTTPPLSIKWETAKEKTKTVSCRSLGSEASLAAEIKDKAVPERKGQYKWAIKSQHEILISRTTIASP